jgi:GR25 family glycosyltransferase involved in LPS biosynthesis
VLNLDRRTDRLVKISAELKRHGLRATRFPAVDGRALFSDSATLKRANRRALRPLTPGLVGNFHAHVSLWRSVQINGWSVAWILEDDALLTERAAARLPSLLAELKEIDPMWHWCYTGRLSTPVSRALLRDEGVERHWPERADRAVSERIVDPGASEGLWGYLLSERGARRLSRLHNRILDEDDPEEGISFDLDLSLHLPRARDGLRMYAFDPVLSTVDESDAFSDDSDHGLAQKLLKLGNRYMDASPPRLAEAEVRFRGALEATVGRDLPKYDHWARSRLAILLDRGGRHPEAEHEFRTSLALAEAGGSLALKELCTSLTNFCYYLGTRNRFDEAMPLCERCIVVEGPGKRATTVLQSMKEFVRAHPEVAKLSAPDPAGEKTASIPSDSRNPSTSGKGGKARVPRSFAPRRRSRNVQAFDEL